MRVRNLLPVALGILVLALGMLACGGTAPERELNLYPTEVPNATQTPLVIIWTPTPRDTPTPNVVIREITQTPNAERLCVNALVAVNLRPSPNDQNYPIMVIPNGTELTDLGSRNGKWIFVQTGDKQGWVNGDYLKGCN
jgi:hypothetical protein